jgi:large subunit ribosomal protein L21
MFAVVRTGGKQYRVAENDRIVVERLAAQEGEVIRLNDVLMVGGDGEATVVGSPTVGGASVTAEVVAHERADKVLIFKKKRRKHYRRFGSHRQPRTVLRIVGIGLGGEPAGRQSPGAETAPPLAAASGTTDSDA